MKNVLDAVDRMVEQLKGLPPVSPENKQKLDKKFRLEFSYNSNHMEGNTLTYGETKLLLMFDETKGNHNLREYEEMKAHDVAYKLIEEWAQETERPLNEQQIKQLNEIILVRPYWKEAQTPDGQNTRRQISVGSYKEFPNSVRLANGEMFDYPSPIETPALMNELIEWYRVKEGNIHAIELAALLHYKFVRIHPFDDGNGRIARLLMNYVLLKNNLPPVIIKSAEKRTYLRALHEADTGDFKAFVSYIAEQAIWSLGLLIKATKGEAIEEEEDYIKEIEMLNRKLKHSEHLNKSQDVIVEVGKTIILKICPLIRDITLNFEPLFTAIDEDYKYSNMNFSKSEIGNGGSDLLAHLGLMAGRFTKFMHLDQSLECNTTLIGLRTSEKSINYQIKLITYFDNISYRLELNINVEDRTIRNLAALKKHYKDSILEEEILQMTSNLKKTLLELIKGETNNK